MLLFIEAINTKESWNQIYLLQNATYFRYDDNVNHPPPPTKKKKRDSQTPIVEKRTQNSDQRLAFGI